MMEVESSQSSGSTVREISGALVEVVDAFPGEDELAMASNLLESVRRCISTALSRRRCTAAAGAKIAEVQGTLIFFPRAS